MIAIRWLWLPFALLVLCTPSPAQTIFHRITGPGSGSRFGFTVDGIGDADGDGFSDFVVGIPSSGTVPPGSVRVYSGLQGTLLYKISGSSTLNGYDQLGWSVSGIGDVNGDGYEDFAATANGNSTTAPDVEVFDGNAGTMLFRHSRLGWSVSGAGDVDADGVPDVIAGGGAPGTLIQGRAKVLSGLTGAVLLSWTADDPTDLFGWSVSGAGDVDGDGRADVVVGAPWDDHPAVDAGRARVYSGGTGSLLYEVDGTTKSDQLGWSVGGGDDLDGDGTPDVLIGVPFDTTPPFGGRVGIFSGGTGTLITWLAGAAPGDAFGSSLAGAGDQDGDGLADWIVGAPGVDANGIDSGSAYTISSATGSILLVLEGEAPFDAMGTAVAGAGDVNQDGFPDLITGAPAFAANQGLAVVYSMFCFSAPPWITQQPQGLAVCSGAPIMLAVAAMGSPPIAYQWRKDGLPLPGRTSPNLTISTATPDDAGAYDAVVSNCGGSVTSDPAVVAVDQGVPPPVIDQQPESAAACAGIAVSFQIGVSGQSPIFSQWRKEGVPIPGATGFQYSIPSVTPRDAGVYDAEVGNCGGTVISQPALLLVNAGVPPPAITKPPQGVSVCAGSAIELGIDATGAPPLSIQWRKDGIPIPGANESAYRVSSASLGDAGDYDVVVSNCTGTVTSPIATVRVAAWSLYGVGTPGTSCTPSMAVGCPLLGTTISLVVLGGLGGGQGIVVLGAAPATIPFLGGTLLVQPPLSSLPFSLGGIPGFPARVRARPRSRSRTPPRSSERASMARGSCSTPASRAASR